MSRKRNGFYSSASLIVPLALAATAARADMVIEESIDMDGAARFGISG